MKNLLIRTGAIAAAATMAIGPNIASAGTISQGHSENATIASNCYGTLKRTVPAGPLANLYLYYSTRNNGTNCAILKSRDGKPHFMSVSIRRSDRADYALDTGIYSKFAGAVMVYNTNHKCIDYYYDVRTSMTEFDDFWDNVTDQFCG